MWTTACFGVTFLLATCVYAVRGKGARHRRRNAESDKPARISAEFTPLDSPPCLGGKLSELGHAIAQWGTKRKQIGHAFDI